MPVSTYDSNSEITCINQNYDGSSFYIGKADGLVAEINSTDLKLIAWYNKFNNSQVLDVQSMYKTLVFTYMNGRIDVFQKEKKKASDRYSYKFSDDQKYPVLCSKMCFEGRVLIAYCENRGEQIEKNDDAKKINLEDDEQEKGFQEFLLIYDVKKKSLLSKEILDLDD